MRRLSEHDQPRNWGPQSTAIPVGGTIAWMVGAAALLFGVASEVPEVAMWATFALPASLLISLGYLLIRRRRPQLPTSLNLGGKDDTTKIADEATTPATDLNRDLPSLHDAIACC